VTTADASGRRAALANSGEHFSKLLGLKFTDLTKDRVRAELTVREEVCTSGQVLHGGAMMSIADTTGAYGTFLNLPPGAGTTTLESKTNFFRAAPLGSKVIATCTPLHRGRTTMVWRTELTSEDGKLLAVVTQTQMVLTGPKSPQETVMELFAGKSQEEQKALLAQLERGGAALYRALAAQENDAGARQALLAAAGREEENARLLEGKQES
jgi:uncharacterized protein (TIGR00369 family)